MSRVAGRPGTAAGGRATVAVALGLASLAIAGDPAGAAAQARVQPIVHVTTYEGTDREERAREQLLRLLGQYDLGRWIFTREVVIRSGAVPHSHPVLTLNTRYLDDDDHQLSAFLHEQFHWYLARRDRRVDRAVDDLKERFPEVPVGRPDGARNEYSTYLHLIVCHLEYRALKELVGMERARAVLEGHGHYRWIYRQVLNDDGRLRELVERHDLDLP